MTSGYVFCGNDNERNQNDHFHTFKWSPESREYKMLGINLEEYLVLDHHTHSIISELNHSLYCINGGCQIPDIPALEALYHALDPCHLKHYPQSYALSQTKKFYCTSTANNFKQTVSGSCRSLGQNFTL